MGLQFYIKSVKQNLWKIVSFNSIVPVILIGKKLVLIIQIFCGPLGINLADMMSLRIHINLLLGNLTFCIRGLWNYMTFISHHHSLHNSQMILPSPFSFPYFCCNGCQHSVCHIAFSLRHSTLQLKQYNWCVFSIQYYGHALTYLRPPNISPVDNCLQCSFESLTIYFAVKTM